MEKRGRKRLFWERIDRALDVDADMLQSGIRIELRGRTGVVIEGVRKILSYTDERVDLRLADGSVSVMGERLICVFYRRGEAAVKGRIIGICFGE